MAGCKPEEWSLKDLARALTEKQFARKKIVVPMFQRRECWDEKKEIAFVDSLRRGFPVGTMLFYKTVDGETEIYTLIDGLQRSNTVKKYMSKPTRFFQEDNIPDDILSDIINVLCLEGENESLKSTICVAAGNYLKSLEKLDRIEKYGLAKSIISTCGSDVTSLELNEKIQNIVDPYVVKIKDEFAEIEKIVIPVLVYTGEISNLPEIFERINSKGVPLDNYEVYAAAWPVERKFKVDNEQVILKVMKKYDTLVADGYVVDGYDGETLRIGRELNAFEYLFGLSRFLNDKYDFLHFDNTSTADTINTMAYELVNACFNDSKDDIPTLYKQVYSVDMNLFERRLEEAIQYVQNIILPVNHFKGNNRGKNKILHGKYQIISMIAFVFKKMYDSTELNQKKATWFQDDVALKKYMLQHYVYDIITKSWADGGTSKIHKAVKENRYTTEITYAVWNSALNMYFEDSNTKRESSKVPNASKEDIIFLNCIYLSLFTAHDQLAEWNFDIEHLATKQSMIKRIKTTNGIGLPIGSIANLCYLPEGINRAKKELTIYQYEPISAQVSEIERKYSFTTHDDLLWIEKDYGIGEFEQLRNTYITYLRKRFIKQKEKFFSTMGIEVEEDANEILHSDYVCNNAGNGSVPPLPDRTLKVGKFIKAAMRNLSEANYHFPEGLLEEMCTLEWTKVNIGRSAWLPFLVPEDRMVKKERYYKDVFVFNGKRFYLYSQLEINSDHLENFIRWYRTLD